MSATLSIDIGQSSWHIHFLKTLRDKNGDRTDLLRKQEETKLHKPEPGCIYTEVLSSQSSCVHSVQLPRSPLAHTAANVLSTPIDPVSLGSSQVVAAAE